MHLLLTINWLTLTWDVLKCLNDGEYSVIFPININMRCIEIFVKNIFKLKEDKD